MPTIHAIYENGVFTPSEPIDLPDHSAVKFELQIDPEAEFGPDPMARVRSILARRYSTGDRDLSERHNEHQP